MPTRVLIVDDDPIFREAIAVALRKRGYEIVGTASSLSGARAAIAEERPDALLLDVNLPDGDGSSFGADMRSDGSRPRILLTSSDPEAVPARLLRRSGATGFVAKAELAVTDLEPFLG
jgi:DNA-binding NarL/FixJ family response regulator